jgi:hypothetical protein
LLRSDRLRRPLRSDQTGVKKEGPVEISASYDILYDSREVRTENILKIYNTLVLPTFLYGSESWTLTALQRRRIEAAEMKLLRPLAGYTFYDHKTNDSVRRELQTECIMDKIDEYRRNWFLHLQRMAPNRIPLKSYHYRPQGRRTIGRPKKRWREQL